MNRPSLPVLLAVALGLRLWLDLDVVPLHLAHLATAVMAALFAVVGYREAPTHPLRWPIALFAGVVVLLGPRDASFSSLVAGGHLLVPLAVLLAAPRLPPRWTTLWLAMALLPVALSVGSLLEGQPDQHVMHGLPRLHGGFRNLHGHAVAMALLTVVAGASALAKPRPATVALAAVAAAMLVLTWVRAQFIFVGLAFVTLLVLRRRWRVLAGLALVALVALWLSPTLQARFADVAAVLTLQPPEEGWGAVGSWRGRIWVESVQAWLAGPPHTWFVGRGWGQQVGLHRDLDPHQEYLSLLFQLGPLGLIAWLFLAGQALRACLQRSTDEAKLAASLVVAVLVTNALSNDFLTRATAQWVVWAAVGYALRRDPEADATAPPPPG